MYAAAVRTTQSITLMTVCTQNILNSVQTIDYDKNKRIELTRNHQAVDLDPKPSSSSLIMI